MRIALLLLPLFTACAARKDLSVYSGGSATPSTHGVTVFPALMLGDAPGAVPEGLDAFSAGLYVGNIVHSGGYVFQGSEDGEDAGLPVRSKEIELLAHTEYTRSIRSWVDLQFTLAIQERDLRIIPERGRDIEEVPLPVRTTRRGSDPRDGTDNVNLPRFDLAPAPWPELASMNMTTDLVIQPWVVLYYSHNGGWFIGQRMGCGSGARLRMFWVVYDAATGAPLSWDDVEARHIDPYLMTPNTAQLEDHLIEVEERVAEEIFRLILP